MGEEKVEPEQIRKLLIKNQIMTIDGMAKRCQCSRNTIFLKLRTLDTITSYNQNKRYQALRRRMDFDENGLYCIKMACFSKWGGVKETIVALVENSPKGLTTGQINETMKIRTNRQLGELVKAGRILRRKKGRHQYYFSPKLKIKERQLQNAQKEWGQKKREPLPPTEVIIQMLVTIINEQETNPDLVQQLLKGQGINLSLKEIEQVFTRYQLKKTRFH